MDDVNLSWRITQRFQVGQSDPNDLFISEPSHGADTDPNKFKTWSKTQEPIQDMNHFCNWKEVEQSKDIEWWDSAWWMVEISSSKPCWSLSLHVHLGWRCLDGKSLPKINHYYQPHVHHHSVSLLRRQGARASKEKRVTEREGFSNVHTNKRWTVTHRIVL